MQCPWCLEEIKDGAEICHYCGKSPVVKKAMDNWAKQFNFSMAFTFWAIVFFAVAIICVMVVEGG